jgi:hypothetical protein
MKKRRLLIFNKNKSEAKHEDWAIDDHYIDLSENGKNLNNDLANDPSCQEMSSHEKANMTNKLKNVINRRRKYEYKLIDFVYSYTPSFKCK